MFRSKSKGLFVDVSEFSILAARTTGHKPPMEVREIAELPLGPSVGSEEIQAFLKNLVDYKEGGYIVSRCGVYPDKRFLRYHELESSKKSRGPVDLTNILRNEYGIDTDACMISIMDAQDGAEYVPGEGQARKLVICGAPTEEVQKKQDMLLQYGLFPERLEISTMTTLGGICDYARFQGLDSPVLSLELTSDVTNVFIQNRGKVEMARPVAFGLDSIYPLLQKELGLKDEASARKLFFSNTFDFAEMGSKLLREITKELQASTGFYEVRTGQTIDRIFLSALPQNLMWVANTVSDALGVELLQPDIEEWMKSLNVNLADGVEVNKLGPRWFALFSLMGEFSLRKEASGE
ncbi:MAG: hypothetical protein ACLFS4_05160 [Opitutales bacterium]